MRKTDTCSQEAYSPLEEANFNHRILQIYVKGKEVETQPPPGFTPWVVSSLTVPIRLLDQ